MSLVRRLSASPPLSPRLHAPATTLPFPLDRPQARLYHLARHGLYQGARSLGLGPGDEVLVPAYHHGSEIEALRRAGLTLRFYEGNALLEPDEGELESLLTPRVRALHLIHYLGFPQDAARWRAWADGHGLLLLEDAAQAWLAESGGEPVGTAGDLAIYSLYKTFGFPDGGALLCSAPPPPPAGRPPFELLRTGRELALWLAGRIPFPKLPRRPRPPYDPSKDFALGRADRPLSRATRWLLPRVVDAAAARRRREHHAFLLARLGEHVPPRFHELEGASPFLFPIAVEDRREVRDRLRERGVFTVLLWSVPHPSLPGDGFPEAQRLRRTLLGLPVHQELWADDLEMIAAETRAALSGGRSPGATRSGR